MIFCFPLNFLAQPLSQVMDSFIPQFSSSATPPNHHPHPPLAHSIHSPIHPSTHLASPIHPYNFTHPFTNPATSPLSVHLLSHPSTFPPIHPTRVFTHPCSLLPTLYHLIHHSISAPSTLQGASQLPLILHHLSLLYVHLSHSSWGPACARPQVLSSMCSIK